MRRFVLGITGASGQPYALRALERISSRMAEEGGELHVVISDEGRHVLRHESGVEIDDFIAAVPREQRRRIFLHRIDDYFAPIASGSFKTDGMLIVPCSMAAAASIACGTGGDLLRRAADVHLKERRPLVLVPREAPLSTIHLRNLLTLAESGAVVFPASPGFYGKPESLGDLVDFVVGRCLDTLGIDSDMAPVWGTVT